MACMRVSCTASAQPRTGANSGQRRGHWGSGQRYSRELGRAAFQVQGAPCQPYDSWGRGMSPNPYQEGNRSVFMPTSTFPPLGRAQAGA